MRASTATGGRRPPLLIFGAVSGLVHTISILVQLMSILRAVRIIGGLVSPSAELAGETTDGIAVIPNIPVRYSKSISVFIESYHERH